jgi:hypothetical protein
MMRQAGMTVWSAGLIVALATGCDAMRIEPVARDGGADGVVERDVSMADGGEDATAPDAGDATTPGRDASTDADPGTRPDATTCMPDQDGTITRAEMPFVVGATVLYAVNNDGTVVEGVDTAGMPGSSGRVWNYAAARAEDHRVLDEVLAPAGQWWASRYPTASFAMVLDRANQIYGVYRAGDNALELLATVSREANRTDLQMDPPVAVLRFPLTEGASWEQTVTGRGLYNFTAFQNVTRYTFRVDARGEVRTPAGRYPVLRLRTDVDQSVPFTAFRRTQRTYTFLSECWGVVARVASVDNESAVEFTRAAEYRRLSL